MSTSFPSAQSTNSAEIISEIDQPFVGRWNQLISTTNWEKGRIIHEWREALLQAGTPASDYADEAWSQRVGGVTSQHVGRLRRVFQRFGSSHDRFAGLYWSHFQAAIDWDDAEMWLEGAVQNHWSVSEMRRTRWETLGSLPADLPKADDVVAAEVDEDFDASASGDPSGHSPDDRRAHFDQEGPVLEGPDFGEDEEPGGDDQARHGSTPITEPGVSVPTVRPFENLRELPADLADAFDAFKLAILRHKAEDWQQVSRDDVLGSLDALKELALAPAAD
jgi:hypothetical protein